MLNVALTGNIASGKSSVVELFRRWGATVIDADELVREAQAPGTAVLAAIAQRFGADVLAADGTLDRTALRSKVMGDDDALSALNAIVHPAVRRHRDELQQAAAARGDAILVNDIPLLFEVLDPAQFEIVVLVDAPVAVRRARLRALRGLSNEDADRMIAAQMPAERKRAKSQFVIENDGTLEQLEARAAAVFTALRHRAAAEVVARIGAPLVIAVGDAKQHGPAVSALEACYQESGAQAWTVGGKAPTIYKTLNERKPPPAALIALPAVAEAARKAWSDTASWGRAFVLDEGGAPLDLRPWGGGRAALNPLA